MNISKFLFVFITLQVCQETFERDLLLTPKEVLQIRGKRIFYRIAKNETNANTPWEQTLKYVTYLTLFENGENNAKIRDLGKYEKFMNSPYMKISRDYPKFGDIITMAQGWLDGSNGYRFIEGACDGTCGQSALALWRVQKIRHRDQKRRFRYEMKFSVTPVKDLSAPHNQILNGERFLKSFILKEDDYPETFNSLTRRSDDIDVFSNERQARIVNETPSKGLPKIPQLNIGEYFKNVPKASPKIAYTLDKYDVHPTTYRPNYHVKFPKPKSTDQLPNEPKTLVTHHFHHHFFMNEPETDVFHGQTKFLANSDAISIIEPPKPNALLSEYNKFHTTQPPMPSIASYMHTVPIFRQTSDLGELHTTLPPITSFRQSEQQIEKIRYSEPDPLYENEGLGTLTFNSETASAEHHPQVELPQIVEVPQVIRGEIFQASVDEFTEATSDRQMAETTTSKPPPRPTMDLGNKANSTTTKKPSEYVSKVSINKYRTYPRSTTEQPVLKWKPKLKPKAIEPTLKHSVQSIQDDVVTVTPSNGYTSDFEVLTKKSVSKSISVKVGNYSKEIRLTEAPTTSTDNPKA